MRANFIFKKTNKNLFNYVCVSYVNRLLNSIGSIKTFFSLVLLDMGKQL
jgi:hypothetical protein